MRFRNGSEGALRVPRSSMVTYCLLMSARFATSVCRGSAGGRQRHALRAQLVALGLLGAGRNQNGERPATEPTGASIGGHRVGGTVIGFVRHSGGIKEGLEAMRS